MHPGKKKLEENLMMLERFSLLMCYKFLVSFTRSIISESTTAVLNVLFEGVMMFFLFHGVFH